MTDQSAPKRLFFCVTPLNLLIAQAIRAREPGRDTLVFVPSLRSAKYQFYFDRFEWDRKIIAANNPGRLPDLAYQAMKTIKVMRWLKDRHFDQLLFANIGSLTFSSVARRYRDAAIATYDDGTLHADAATLARWLNAEPLSHRLYRRFTGALSNQAILARVTRHYTIFPAEFGAADVPDVVEIPLFANLATPSQSARPLRVLLGTPEPQNVLGIDFEAYSRLVTALDPHVYLPHPRETRPAEVGVPDGHRQELIEAARVLAAEDFVQELVRRGYNPSIEGFGSTALLNLSRQFATKTYFPSFRPPQPIFEKLGVMAEPLEPHLS